MWKELEIRIKRLEQRLDILSDQLNKAFIYIEDDPHSSLTKSRTILEQILLNIYKLEMSQEPKRIELGAILTDNQFTRKIDKRIISRMNSIRDMCNLGVHGEKIVSIDAKIVLDNLCEVLEWYFENYKTIKSERKEQDSPIESVTKPKRKLMLMLSGIITVVIVFVITVIYVYPKIIKRGSTENLSVKSRISIVVMPFQNMTNDTTWNIWQNGIQNELINILTNSEELKVKQTKSITGLLTQQDSKSYASITPSIASAISKKLDAGVFLYGSIKQAGSVLRVNAQLINTKTEEVLKSFTIERPAKEELIFQIIDTLSLQIRNFLIISELKKEFSFSQQVTLTTSAEAYRYYIYGLNAWKKGDNPTAIDWYSHALNIDTNFILAALDLSSTYRDMGMSDKAEELFLKVYRKRDKMSIYWKLTTNYIYSRYYETPYEELKYLIQLYELDDQYFFPRMIGKTYLDLFQYDKAIPALEESKDIYEKLGNLDPDDFTTLGFAYHKARQYKKEKKLYREAEKFFPDDADLIYRQAILLLNEGDTISANRYIKKYVSIRNKESDPEIGIIADLGVLYSETGILDKAEEYYREALSIEPDSSGRMNTLAYFLIEKDRDVKEGLELVNNALNLRPDNYDYLDTQGWGLYKQGKYKEALDVLQKSWYLRRKLADYNHSAYLHLEEAKNAVAKQ